MVKFVPNNNKKNELILDEIEVLILFNNLCIVNKGYKYYHQIEITIDESTRRNC